MWGIILAGGEGKRLQEFTKSIYGYLKPKQFCVFTGTRSMFKHTIDRARLLISPERMLSVIQSDHVKYTANQLEEIPPHNVLLAPCNKETAASIIYSILRIEKSDPDGFVALFPSDHFVLEEEEFVDNIRDGFGFLTMYPDNLVILAVDASYPETGYGWIEQGEPAEYNHSGSFFKVKHFWEKPDKELAQALMARNCLWNTMITLGTVRTFLRLFHEYLPQLYLPFAKVKAAIGTPHEQVAVETVFRSITPFNFSSSLLQRIPKRLRMMHVSGIHWSDWGERDRIVQTLDFLR